MPHILIDDPPASYLDSCCVTPHSPDLDGDKIEAMATSAFAIMEADGDIGKAR